MFNFLSWCRTVATAAALAGVASAQPALTTIEDVLYRADGTRFNGTLTITWNDFQTGDDNPIPAQGLTVSVINGYLKVRLAPTTNASAGANYSVTYSSQGEYLFAETWAVPSTTSVLRLRDVRVGVGSVVGPAQPITAEVMISDVTGLTNELNARPLKGTGYAPSRAAVIDSGGLIDGATGNLGDCVHVDGSSGPCGTAAGSNVAYSDGETPSGLVNGANTVFNLNFTPSPAASLMFYRNGILMKQGNDYLLSGNTVTFFTAAVPESGDLLTASYRYLLNAVLTSPNFADSETPSGSVNGSNTSFTLLYAPSPAASLQLFRNGVLMTQAADYTVSANTVTFNSISVPQPGDVLTAYYRY
jgi:hypothetical protein